MSEDEEIATAVRGLIANLQPGEVLVVDEIDDLSVFDRREARSWRVVDRVWLNGGIGQETVSDLIRPEIDAMVARGELVYGPGCSEWHRPA